MAPSGNAGNICIYDEEEKHEYLNFTDTPEAAIQAGKSKYMKISVIVPVYNVEHYIEECLDSLLAQNLSEEEYEIICIDDGSTDRSGEIAERYGKLYRQIRIIRQKNGGLSKARNEGLKIAQGEYVCFVDSDDYIQTGILNRLYDLAVRYNLDKLMYGYQNFKDGERLSFNEKSDRKGETLLFFQDASEMDTCKIVPDWKVAWNYLIKRSVIERYDLHFMEGILFEDEEFDFWLNHSAGSSGYIDQKIYYYRMRDTSILRTFRDDSMFSKYIKGRCKLVLHHRKVLEDYSTGKLPDFRIPLSRGELENRLYCEIKGMLSQLICKADTEIFEAALDFLKNEELYPYPLRFYWQKKNGIIKRVLIMFFSFWYPKEGYIRFCIKLSCLIKRIRYNVKDCFRL